MLCSTTCLGLTWVLGLMSINGVIFLVVFAAIGIFCLRVLVRGLWSGAIRSRFFYGPVAHKEASPTDFWYAVFFWAVYTVAAFGAVFLYFYDASRL